MIYTLHRIRRPSRERVISACGRILALPPETPAEISSKSEQSFFGGDKSGLPALGFHEPVLCLSARGLRSGFDAEYDGGLSGQLVAKRRGDENFYASSHGLALQLLPKGRQ